MLRSCVPAALLLALSAPVNCLGQAAAPPVRLSGSIGVTAKGYMADGIDDRRAPTALEATANTRFSVFGLSSGFRLTYSTDQSGLRQSVNRLSFQSEWGSGRVAAGDVSPDYSQYSVRGATVRGGLVEWQPSSFFVGVSGGRSRRSVDVASALDRRGSVFSRWLGSARIGVGVPEDNHVHMIAVYSKDVASSITDPGDLRPNANVSLSPDVLWHFLSRRLVLRGSATLSSISDDSDQSSATFGSIFGSDNPDIRSTYASEVAARFSDGVYGLDVLFQRVMPGFESHGLSQIRSDEQTIRLAPRMTLGQGRLTLAASAARTNTNLLDDQLSTTYRDLATLAAALRLSARVTLAANYAGLRNSVDPAADATGTTVQQKQVGHNVVVAPVFVLGSSTGVTQTIAVNGAWQTFRDRSSDVLDGLREGFESTNKSIMLTHSMRLTPSFSTSLSGGLVKSDASTTQSTITTLNAGLSVRLSSAWSSSVTAGWAQNESESLVSGAAATSSSQRLSAAFGSTYTISRSGSIRLDVRAARNDLGDDVPAFSESTATLGYTHRF